MASCDQGYLCTVCGGPVAVMADSSLYLRFVMGEVHPDGLWTEPEAHILCRPELAQHIRDPAVGEVLLDIPSLDRRRMPEEERRRRDDLVTRAFRRLLTLPGGRHVLDYPLPDTERCWSLEELGERWKGSGI